MSLFPRKGTRLQKKTSDAVPEHSAESGQASGLPRAVLALCIFSGALCMALGHPNFLAFQVPALALGTPFVLYMLAWFSPSPGAAFRQGWLSGFFGLSAALYWLYLPITQVGGLPLPFAVPCVLLLASYLAVYTGLACLAMRNFQAPSASFPVGALLYPLAAGLSWGGLEILQGWLFTGFPWLCLSTAFAPWPTWIQAASAVGAPFLSGLYAAGACLLASALLRRQGRALAFGLSALILAGLPLYGESRLAAAPPPLPTFTFSFPATGNAAQTITQAPPRTEAAPAPEYAEDAEAMRAGEDVFNVLMVQGNIDQNQKWVPAFQQMSVDKYMFLSGKGLIEAAALGVEVDLILWPETAMPFFFQPNEAHSESLRRFARNNRTSLAFGLLGHGGRGSRQNAPVLFNRVLVISPNGPLAGTYDKEHLVPFGEYTPLALEFEFLDNLLQGVGFSSGSNAEVLLIPLSEKNADPFADAYVPPPPKDGEEPRVVIHGPGGEQHALALGMLICYEVIFPELAQKRVAGGASVLATVSNDAWFGKTPAPRQHLHLAAMRSVEQKRPMLRATNTGYTAAIDAYGRIYGESALFEEAVSIARVRSETDISLFHSLYPLLQGFLLLVTLFAFLPSPAGLSRRISGIRG